MKILIDCNDSIFSYGLELIITEFFYSDASFFYDLTLENVIEADLIFASAIPRTMILCNKLLKENNKATIFCIIDETAVLGWKHRPKCLKYFEFISKKIDVNEFLKLMSRFFIGNKKTQQPHDISGCGFCVYSKLSPANKEIAFLYVSGHDLFEISNLLKLPYKYITSHRYTMMQRLNLNNKMQLLNFYRWFVSNGKN